MGTRLYEEFMRKLKVPPVQRFNKKQENKEIVIAIPLKGGNGVFTFELITLVTYWAWRQLR